MAKFLIAALLAATLGSSAQAAVTPQDQAWIDKMTFAVNDALAGAPETSPMIGVASVPVTVDAKGHLRLAETGSGRSCPGLSRDAIEALNLMGKAPRPPADLVGQPITVQVRFEPAPSFGHLNPAAASACE